MGDRPHPRLSRETVSRLFPVFAVGVFVAACHDAEQSLAPKVGGPRFSASASEGLTGRIAFHSNRDGDFDIYVMNADGSGVTNLTNNTVPEFDPVWSPNGKQLTFGRISGNGAAVVVINVDGSGEKVLTNNGFPGAWSPDGRQIAFSRNGDVYVMNVDGSGVTQLTHDGTASPTAWSPNGKQIAFTSYRSGNSDIYVMNVDGSGVIQLTNDPATDFGDRAGWSPDGKRFVFSSTRDGGDIDIFVMNSDGSGVTPLTQNDGIADDDPVWSPDGKKIAFHSTRDGGDEDIFVMNTDGTDVIPLTNNTALADGTPIFDAVPVWTASASGGGGPCLAPPAGLRSWWPLDGDLRDISGANHGLDVFWDVFTMNKTGSKQIQLTNAPRYNARPNWSHDGRRITFTACRATDFSCDIYVMNADGSGQTNLTNDFSNDYMSVWSPDDRRIAFVSERDGSPQIYVMNADGSSPTRLTQSGVTDVLPTWSPDGARIAFQTYRDGNSEIYVMNADGSNPINFTQHPASDEFPAWSPSGDKIAFDSYRDGNYEIYTMKPDGSAQTRVTNNPGWDADPAWRGGSGSDQVLAVAVARETYAPAQVREGFSFERAGDVVFAPGAGIDGLQQLTIDLWVKHNSLPPGRIARYVTLQGQQGKAVLRYDGENGPAQLHFYMGIDGQLQHIRVNNALQVGVFQHIAGSYDGSVMRLYLDGVEVGSLPITGTVDGGFGALFSSGDETMDGVLDEIQVFDRALTASEIHAIFEAGSAGQCKQNVPGA